MTPGKQLPPGRAGRLWLRDRLDIAERGVSLLEQKLRILDGELRRFRSQAEQTRSSWERACSDARMWQLRAELLGGQRSIRLASTDEPATVTVTWTSTMGIRYPAGIDCALPPADSADVVTGSAAVVHARQAHREALVAATAHAATSAAVDTIEREIRSTRRRARALSRHWLPHLRAELARIELELEEAERADAVRLSSATSTERSSVHE